MTHIDPLKNIIFFSLESRNASFYKTYGGAYSSPNMTRLAERSVMFNSMFSAAPSTAMSLKSVLSGQYAHQSDRVDYSATAACDQPDLFQAMKNSGRECHFVVSDRVEDHVKNKITDSTDIQRHYLTPSNSITWDVANQVVKISKSTDKPLFIFAHTAPCQAITDESIMTGWRNGIEQAVFEDDRAIKIILDNIDLENTTLVVYADHGVLAGEHHHLFRHAFFLYDEALHVPCFVTCPKTGINTDLHSLTQISNFALDKAVYGLDQVIADSQYVLQPHRMTTIRTTEWKYIAHYNWSTAITGLQEELYDLVVDPGEHRNLLNDISRHPLRIEWTKHNVRHPASLYKYNEQLVEHAVFELRPRIAEIWTEGFLNAIYKRHNEFHNKIESTLRTAYPTEQMAIVGTFAEILTPRDPIYGPLERAISTDREYHLKYFPELPTNRKNTNYSKLLSPSLDNLFSGSLENLTN